MIVVSTQNDVLVGFPGHVGKDVVDSRMGVLDVHVERELEGIREREGSGLCLGIDVGMDLGERLTSRFEPGIGNRVFHLGKEDANVFRAV